jgi:hypothetical protein
MLPMVGAIGRDVVLVQSLRMLCPGLLAGREVRRTRSTPTRRVVLLLTSCSRLVRVYALAFTEC